MICDATDIKGVQKIDATTILYCTVLDSFTTFLRLVSEQVHEDSKRAQAEFRAEWRKKIGMALHNTVAKQYLISLQAHTTEQAGLGYME